MKLRVNRYAQPVTVLGPGRRLGLWVQGCGIGCPGCASVDTWDPAGGETLDTEVLARHFADLITEHRLTGLSITGGEPTEQAPAVADLVVRLRQALSGRSEPLDVLLFTGRSRAAAARSSACLWRVVDAAVCGPYRPTSPATGALTASGNQELVTLTRLGQSRHATAEATPVRSLQAHVAAGEITLIGLPDPGDLPRLEEALRRRGVAMGGRSWLE